MSAARLTVSAAPPTGSFGLFLKQAHIPGAWRIGTIDTGPSGITASNTATFAFHASEGSTFSCQLDAEVSQPCTSPVAFSGLAAGTHAFTVVATDGAGNADPSAASLLWIIDTEAPETAITEGPAGGSATTSTSATFAFTATDNVSAPADLTFECSLDGAAFASCSSPITYSGLDRIPHTVAVRAVDQAGNKDVTPATVSWIITKIDQTITFGALAAKTYGDADFAVSATSSSGLAVVFSSQTPTTCTVSASTVHLVAAGNCTIRAAQSGDTNYNAAPNVDQSFTINSKAASVTASDASKTYGDSDPASFATTNSGFLAADLGAGKITFSASRAAGESAATYDITPTAHDSGTGLLSNYTVTFTKGTFTIGKKAASVTPDAKGKTYGDPDPVLTGMLSGFVAGDGVTASYSRTAGDTVTGSPYTISATLSPAGVLGNYNITYNTASFTIVQASSTTTVTCPASVTYDGSAQTPCTATVTGAGGLNQPLTVSYSGNTNAGTATASASYGGDANHMGSSGSHTFTITQASSTTTVSCPASVMYDGSAQTPCSATVTGVGGLSQPLTVSYSSNTNAGTATASASYGGDANHMGSSGSHTFTITQASSTTTVSCPASVTYDGSAQTPCSATVTGAGGLNQPLTVSYSGNTNAGTATASASYGGDANHTASSGSQTFTITQASSTTTVTCPASVTYDGSAQTPCSATATGAGGLNQPLTVSYSGNTNAGTATASASYAGDANHTGSSGSQTFTVAQASQTISFGTLFDRTYGDPPFTVSAAASSGLSVTFTAAGNCSVVETTVTIAGAGACTITASQPGDANYLAATDMTQALSIAKAVQTITFGALAPRAFGDPPFTVAASASSGLPVSFSVLSGPATISGDTVTIAGAGVVILRAWQAGDANHLPAPNIDQSFQVIRASLAGPPTVDEMTAFTLDGSASVGTDLSSTWEQIAGPTATLETPASTTTGARAPALPGGFGSQMMTFKLTVTLGSASSSATLTSRSRMSTTRQRPTSPAIRVSTRAAPSRSTRRPASIPTTRARLLSSTR